MKPSYLSALVLTALIAGCGGKKPAAPAAAPPSAAQSAGEMITGSVSQVDDRAFVASVTGVDATKFKEDDIMVFLDTSGATIADGKVQAVVEGGLHVKYNVIAGGRAPREGDLAVHFTR